MNMQVNFSQKPNINQKVSFNGYGAAPLKQIFYRMPDLPRSYQDNFVKIYEEVAEVGKKHGFEVILQAGEEFLTDFKQAIGRSIDPVYNWLQDTCTVLENKKMIVQRAFDVGDEAVHSRRIAEKLGIRATDIKQDVMPGEMAGGNYFICKNSNGSKFAMVGEDCNGQYTSAQLKNLLEVDRIYFVPQLDYHIDLGVRPLIGKKVLVADDNLHLELTEKIVQKLEDDKANKALNAEFIKQYKSHIKAFKKEMKINNKWKGTSNCEDTIASLTNQGFDVVRVPGRCYYVDKFENKNVGLKYIFNYMNAVVHQNPKGELVYITNSAPEKAKIFDSVFENYLKQAAPEIKEVVFVSGNGDLAKVLHDRNGGVHCLGSETPDFERWKV